MGWVFFYAGISKLLNPTWSAAGYLNSAQSFKAVFAWFATPSVLPVVNFLNEWGLLLIGLSLLLGIFVRLSSVFGVALMALYYIPALNFPYAGKTGFLVDEHVIYTIVLLALANLRAGRAWGLEEWCSKLKICARYPALRKMLG